MSALKDARERAGFTQKQVAAMTGIALGTLRRWEQGVNEPDIDAIMQLADFYGVSTDELLGSGFAVEYNSNDLTDDERYLIDLFRAMDDDKRSALLAVARAM